jgi:prepilin peptidase CpaA
VITLAAVVSSAGTGAAVDLRTRRIPNGLTIGAAALGVTLAATGATHISVIASLAGFALGMLLMIPGHVLGATGAGDVKLVGALGAIVGVGRIVPIFLYSAIAGGLLALGYALYRGRLGTTLEGAAHLMTARPGARAAVEAPGAGNRFPFGPAIAAGAVLVGLGF